MTRPARAFLLQSARALALLGWLLAVPLQAEAQQRPRDAPPQQVGTVKARLSQVPQMVTLPGRAVAFETAAVRPRVGGMVEAITYEPGQPVKAGTPMFRLETETLDTALASAEAAEAGAVQARDSAAATVERYRTLVGKGVTRVDLEAAEVALSQAEAALAMARSERQAAALDRARAVITAPISGEAGLPDVTIGALVTANQTEPLATITRVDPIYVDVAAASTRVLQARQRIRSGEMTPLEPPRVTLTLEDGTEYGPPGEIVSTGSTVSTTTGTLGLRLQFPNPDRLILPGQFLRVAMTLGTVPAVLVPQRATTRLADGSLAAFVLDGDRAKRVTLTESGVWNNAWAVTQGVAPGDAVIVDGLGNLRDGATVEAVPVTLDENGVVVPAEPSAPQAGGGGAVAAAVRPAPVESQPPPTRGWLDRLRSALGLSDAAPARAGPGAAAPTAPLATGVPSGAAGAAPAPG